MTLMLLMILASGQGSTMNLDEIYLDGLICSVTDEQRTAWIGFRREGPQILGQLYIFEHATRKAHLVSDGRFHVSGRSYLFKTEDGYALINVQARTIFFLDVKGNYLDKLPFENLIGFEPDYQILSTVPKEEGIGVTFRMGNDWSKLLLAELNLETRQFSTIYLLEDPPEKGTWVFDDKAWLFLNQKTGRIDLLDQYFNVEKTLIPDMEPRLSVKNKQVARLMRDRGFSPFVSHYEGFFVDGKKITTWRLLPEEDSPKWGQLIIENSEVKFKKGGAVVLATLQNHQLVFDRNEGEFLVQ